MNNNPVSPLKGRGIYILIFNLQDTLKSISQNTNFTRYIKD